MSFHTGDVFVVSPRESHLAQSTPGTNSRWIWIYADIEKLLCQFCEEHSLLRTSHFAGENFRNVISPSAQPKLCQLLRDFCEEAQRETPFKHDSLRALLLLIMAELQRLAPEGAERPGGEPDSMARIQKALVYLIQHYREKLRLDDLARLCAVSRTHFRRLFRQALGHSPQDHLNQIRIMMSVAELRQNRKSISEIALSCGFPSLSSFNRQFKAQMGKAPREWRRSSVDKGLFL